jgi:hypothetical protein
MDPEPLLGRWRLALPGELANQRAARGTRREDRRTVPAKSRAENGAFESV